MLNWAITFFIIALIAALLGYGGLAGMAAGAGQMLLQVFLVIIVIGIFIRTIRST